MLEYIAILILVAIIVLTTFDVKSIFYSAQEQYDSTLETISRVPPMTIITLVLLAVAVALGFLVSLPK
jgi:heme A synthase